MSGGGGTFVDGGGFTGDTLEQAIALKIPFSSYHFFEPDVGNYQKAKASFGDDMRVHFYNKGLWSKEETLCFDERGSGTSEVSQDGGERIAVTALDSLHLTPDFIKMDIEGAEMEALLGAEQTIRQHKPTLAICVYHKLEDIFTIPHFILQCNPSYILYLRHYTDSLMETVCYAISPR